MQKLLISLLSVASLLGSGCAIYKIDVQQGNRIEQEAVDQLKPGMTKKQVEFLLGTPLIVDPFHEDRWDYVYSYQRGGGKREQTRMTVFFERDALVRVEGDIRPREGTQAASAEPKESQAVTVPVQDEEKGFFGHLKDWVTF
jgi:outer membrane protein assembly factor BamE